MTALLFHILPILEFLSLLKDSVVKIYWEIESNVTNVLYFANSYS